MKFSVLSSLVAFIAVPALADSQIRYFMSSSDLPAPIAHSTITFEGFGPVAANLVCKDSVKNVLRTTIPAHMETLCDETTIDRSDSTHPVVVCATQERRVPVAAQAIETALTHSVQVCIDPVYDRMDSAYPKMSCGSYETQIQAWELDYTLEVFAPSDYLRQNSTWESRTIEECGASLK